jgi:DNA-binding MarR family transcriptional regulator
MEHGDITTTVRNLMQEITKGFSIIEKNVSVSCGITPSQWSTLLAFDDSEVLKMNELSKRLTLATSTMTRMVDNLVKEGFVERKQDFTDRRAVIVCLTAEGKHLAERIHRLQSEYFNSLLDHIDVDMRGQVVASLNNLLIAFHKFEI